MLFVRHDEKTCDDGADAGFDEIDGGFEIAGIGCEGDDAPSSVDGVGDG